MKQKVFLLQIIIQATVFVFLSALLYKTIWFYKISYSNYANYLAILFNKPHFATKFTETISYVKYSRIQYFLLCISCTLFILNLIFIFKLNVYQKITNALVQLFFKLKKVYQIIINFENTRIKWAWWLLVLISFITSIYWIINYEITNDEAVTYIMFSSKGPFVSASFYPAANNHFLFSILSSFFINIPINPTYSLRLVNLFALILFLFSINFLCKRHYSERILIITSFFICSTPFFIQYSFLARGYLFVLLFSTLSIHFYLSFIKSNFSKKKLLLFALINALGMYSVLTYVYFLIPVYASLFIMFAVKIEIKKIILLIQSLVYLIVLFFILFSPVIFISGLGALNSVVKQVDTINRGMIIIQILISGYSASKIILLFTFTLLLYRIVKLVHKKIIEPIAFLTVLTFLLLAIIVYIFKALVFERNWIHIIILLSLEIAYVLSPYIKKLKTNTLLLSLFFVYLFNYYLFLQKSDFLKDKKTVSDEKELFLLLKNNGLKKIFFNDLFIKNHLDYYALINKYQFEYSTNNVEFSYANNFDSTIKYDVIIKNKRNNNDQPFNVPIGYSLFFNTNDCNIYIKNNF